jgi:hypothetical protein
MEALIRLFLPSRKPLALSREDLVVSLCYAKRIARVATPDVDSSIGPAQPMSCVTYGEPVAGAPLALIEMLHEVVNK